MAGSVIYLGSPGNMKPTPVVSPDWTPKALRFSALVRGLSGRGTETLFGPGKTGYTFEFPYCYPSDLAWLDLCWEGAIKPLTLIDPTKPNRFPRTIAMTGASSKGVNGFLSTVGIVSSVSATTPSGVPTAAKLTSGTSIFYPGVVVVPGEVLTLTSYIHATGPVVPSVSFIDSTGVLISTINGATVATGGTFIQSSFSATAPANTATATYTLASSSGNIDIYTSAWNCTTDGSTAWTSGGGQVPVAMTAYSGDTPMFPYTTVSVSFEEL